jgi:AraC-like DNA-binding protein
MAIDWSSIRIDLRSATRVQWRNGVVTDRSWPRHVSDNHAWFVLGGRATLHLRGQPVKLRAGSGVWMVPGHDYTARQDPRRPLLFYAVHFDLVDRATGHNLDTPGIDLPQAVQGLDTAAVNALMSLVLGPRETGWGRLEFEGAEGAWAGALVTALLACFESRLEAMRMAPARKERAGAVRRQLDDCAQRLLQDLAHPPSVGELAQSIGLSPNNFSQRFRRRFDLPPQRYVQQHRLNRSRQLLRETELSVKEIAFHLGYHDAAHFSRQFKQWLSVSPTEFRRQSRKRGR